MVDDNKDIELDNQKLSNSPQQANLGNDADTVFGILCSTYYELNCNADTDEVNRALDELYQTTTGKTIKEKDDVIYTTCRLCSLHQQTDFIDGLCLRPKTCPRTKYLP